MHQDSSQYCVCFDLGYAGRPAAWQVLSAPAFLAVPSNPGRIPRQDRITPRLNELGAWPWLDQFSLCIGNVQRLLAQALRLSNACQGSSVS